MDIEQVFIINYDGHTTSFIRSQFPGQHFSSVVLGKGSLESGRAFSVVPRWRDATGPYVSASRVAGYHVLYHVTPLWGNCPASCDFPVLTGHAQW
jgi:hypothetical protein